MAREVRRHGAFPHGRRKPVQLMQVLPPARLAETAVRRHAPQCRLHMATQHTQHRGHHRRVVGAAPGLQFRPQRTPGSLVQQRLPVVLEVAAVAAQSLVGTLPVEHHLDAVLSGQLHELVTHQRRHRVQGFVVGLQRHRQGVPELPRRALQSRHRRTGLLQRGVDVHALVESRVHVAEGGQGTAGAGGAAHTHRSADDGGRVQAAGQMHSHRHVAAHVQAHGVFEQVGKRLRGVGRR